MTSEIRLGNMSIKRQLVISLMVVIIPFVMMGVITYRYNMGIVTEMLSKNKLHTLDETARTVDQLLSDVEAKARQVGWDANVQAFLSKDEDLTNYDDFKIASDAQKMMTKLTLASGSINTLIAVPNKHRGFTTTTDGKGFMSAEDAMKFDWYRNMEKESDVGRWFLTSKILDNPVFGIPTVTYVSPVKLLSTFNIVGDVMVSIDRNVFKNIISAKSTTSTDRVFLLDAGGSLISSTDKNYPYTPGKTLDSEKQSHGEGWYYMGSGPSQYLVTYVTLPRYGWQLASMVSVSAVSAELISLSEMMYMVIIVCVLLSLILAMALYRGITKPLDNFVERMKSIARGDFTLESTEEKTDNEIKKIYSNFNWMSGRIAGLIDKNNETMLQKRDAELKALQAQINPHFLYNVLDTINWMAIMKDEDDISKAITNLSAFYRTILNDGKDTVTIKQEIEHVKAYIEIEKLRYKNCFNVVYELDESLFSLYTIKFILQPFIENALMHGFNYSKQDNRITIRLYEKGACVYFEIMDNGEGISREKIRQILTEKVKGYGVANVDERIKLRFGDQYGVVIESESGAGTTVRIDFPKVGENNEERKDLPFEAG